MQTCATEDFLNTSRKKVAGVDILRILAMFLVCAHHSDEFGLWAHIEDDIVSQSAYAIWRNFTYMGVNLFMLITGYCCICSQWRLSRYISLYLQVAFYSTGYIILFLLASQDITRTCQNIVDTCLDLPFAGGYWYFTTYTGLFFLIPFLNKLIHSLNSRQFKWLIAGIILVFSILNIGSHSCISQSGENLIWMIVCYILGAYLRLTRIPGNSTTWFILFLITLLASTSLNHFFPILKRDYTAPFFFGSCLCIFLALSRIQMRNQTILRILSWAAPLSFGVYLFHNHPLLWPIAAKAGLRVAYAIDFSWVSWLVLPVLIYTIGTCADWLRALLFKKMNINQLSDKISNFLTKATEKAFRMYE